MSDHDDYEESVEAAVRLTAASLESREKEGETPEMEDWMAFAVDPRNNRDNQP